MSELKQKTIKGIVWSSFQRFGMMAINLASNIVLARLLTPDDFGCVAMLMIFITLANTIIDGGFGAALIQKKEPTQLDYSTIFYLNICLSIILYFVLFFSAPYIASFYRIPLLSKVLRVQGLVLFLNALSIIQQNILRKNLRFKTLSIIYIISGLSSFSIAIFLAYRGYGVWSLVFQQLSMSLMLAILFWLICEWRPLIAFSIKSFKELFAFGSFMLLTSLFSSLSTEIQGLLVGRRFNSNYLGLYNQAYRLEGSASTAISSLMDQVTFPVLSSLQDNRTSYIQALKRFIQIPAYVSSLVMMILIVIAKPLIVFLYTDKWVDAVPYFQILCTAGLAVGLQGTANNALAAIGKSKVLFNWTIIKRSITIVFCFVGILVGGMYGLLWMCVAGAWTVYFINSYLISKHIGYSFYTQLLDIIPSIFLSAIVGFVVYFLGEHWGMHYLLKAFVQVLMCSSLYLLFSIIFRLSAYEYICELIRKKLHR
jgi:O-antigen/teichoic acid export membrane protein